MIEEYSVKTAMLANNDFIEPHIKAKFLNIIWRLNITPD